ncbi:MAG: tetratricopeptide repeat protein [Chitinivibrionales bacterium]|nr:tetratricopeptide repeat protein [Chitinivibrionales bacterium]MBD3396156.1 tetratricopeptide repeat protein [Chitinivibrionales bacterium]
MDIKSMLAFEEKEKKLLKLVFFISLGACLAAVGIAWGIQKARLSARVEKQRAEAETSDMLLVFEKHTRDLLTVDLDAHRFASRHFAQTNRPQEAIPHLLRLLSVDDEDREVRLALGEAYLKAGMYDKALRELSTLNAAKESDSLTKSAMALQGLALFHTGQYDASIELLDETLQLYPGSAEAACYRGQVEAALNSGSKQAEDYFRKALEIDSTYAEPLYQWARFDMNRPGRSDDDLDSARRRLLRLLKIEPLNPKAHARLGMLYYYLGYPDISEKSYRTALALNPADYNTRYNLGELYTSLYWNRQDLSEDAKAAYRRKALTEFKKTLEIEPDHANAHFKIGLISLENNMLNAAVRHFEQARKLSPENIRILLQLGVAYEKKDMHAEAMSVYNAVLDIDPVNQVAQQKVKLLSGVGR